MKCFWWWLPLALASTSLLSAEQHPSSPSYDQKLLIDAKEAARHWILLVDQGQYAESWKKASPLFQEMISEDQWVIALQLARNPLGAVIDRKLQEERPSWNPQGLPPGDYMVITYTTSFDEAPNSGELLTLRKERNGEWKVLTYQVN